jgi:hypothetical protein
MSHEGVEVLRTVYVYELWRRTGGPPRHLFDPDIELWESPELPGDLAGKGYDNLLRANEILLDSFDEWWIEPERFFDLGDRILTFVRFRGIGKGSGAPVDARMAYLSTLRNGKVIEWGLFGDRSNALRAAGLQEQ